MTLYASLSDVASAQQSEEYTAEDEEKFLFYSRVVSRRIDAIMASNRPYFAPYIETRRRRAVSVAVNSADGTFSFNTPLLVLNAVSKGETTLTVPTNVDAYSLNDTPPYYALQLADCYGSWHSDCAGCGYGAPLISISGIWGYHGNYAEAWQRVNTLNANINDSVTAFVTATAIDGDDVYGMSPGISAGNLVKIGDEMMEVIATDIANETATVRRAVNGSTAAAHTAADAIYVWYPEWQIRSVTARQAALMYARRGGYNAITPGDGNTTYPPDLLQELLGVLQDFGYGG